MAELSGNQVSYRNQATGGPVTSSSRFDGLNQRVGASTHPLLSCTVDPLRMPERYALIDGHHLLYLGNPAIDVPQLCPLHEHSCWHCRASAG